MKKTILFLLFGMLSGGLWAQTASDSITLAQAEWHSTPVQSNMIYKHAFFRDLYQSTQYVSILEITPGKQTFHLAVNPEMRKSSETAIQLNALAALNGSYYNMKSGKSICYLKQGKCVSDTTTASEFALRVTGAVQFYKGKLALLPWNKTLEKKYKSRKDTILSSGPLLRYQGHDCDYSMCDSSFLYTRHPRTILGLKKDGTVLFITVDGRSRGNAMGMTIPELTYLCRQLDCYQAINLDGGGSTTLWAKSRGVLNHPSDNKRFDHEGERSVANVIYFR